MSGHVRNLLTRRAITPAIRYPGVPMPIGSVSRSPAAVPTFGSVPATGSPPARPTVLDESTGGVERGPDGFDGLRRAAGDLLGGRLPELGGGLSPELGGAPLPTLGSFRLADLLAGAPVGPTRAGYAESSTQTLSARPADYEAAQTTIGKATPPEAGLLYVSDAEVEQAKTPDAVAALQKKNDAVFPATKKALQDADAAMKAGNYGLARQKYAEAGLPLPKPAPDPLSAQQTAALLILGAGTADLKDGFRTNPHYERGSAFRAVDGMAHRANLLAAMQDAKLSPSNPPTRKDLDAFLAAKKGASTDDKLAALALVQNGTQLHYVESDTPDGNVSYPKGYPTSAADVDGQPEVGGRHRVNCQAQAMSWYENARAVGLKPVGLIAVDKPEGADVGHALAVVQDDKGRTFVCSGNEFVEVKPKDGKTVTDADIKATAARLCDEYYQKDGKSPSYTMRIGRGDDVETASKNAYQTKGAKY